MNQRGPDPGSSSRPARINAEALFRKHGRFVAHFVARLGVRGHDVEDLVQEVFLLVHRQGGFVPGPAKPTTWLAEIALRLTMSAQRRARRSPLLPNADETDRVVSHMTPHDELVQARALQSVQTALQSLDMERRAIFILYEMDGESCDAIARAFDIPIGTVYSRLHTARDEFLHAYARLVGVEPSSLKRPAPGSRP